MKKILFILLFFPLGVWAQTSTENYILTKTYKVPSTQVITDTDPTQTSTSIQYFDGLGRPKQNIAHKAGGQQQDIITPIGYDSFGRQTMEYLPYATTNNSLLFDAGLVPDSEGNISILNSFYDNKFPNEWSSSNAANPYSKKQLDNSPLNRVLQQAAPGKDWKIGAGHTIHYNYEANKDNEVLKFRVRFIGNQPELVLADDYYAKNTLYKTVTKDENWRSYDNKDHTTEEFKNKQGQVLLKRTYNNQQPHDTYYVYDNFGNLSYVLPPLASEQTNVYETGLTTYPASTFVNKGGDPTGSVKFGVRQTAPGNFEYYADFNLHNLASSTFKTGYIMDLPHYHPAMGSYINLGSISLSESSAGSYAYRYFYFYARDGKLYSNSYEGSSPGYTGPALVISDFDKTTNINLPENLAGFSETETQEQKDELLEKLGYQYKYDDRNRLIEKKIPGKGWESIVYDKLDRPVLTQDAVQETQQKWNFTKYDNLGRVAYTGIFTSSNTRPQMQSQFDAVNDTALKLYETKKSSGTGFDGTYYTNSNFPYSNLEILTVNYYDNYTFNRAGAPTTVNVYGVNSTTNLKSLATGSRIKVLDQSPQKWITTVTYYDEKARPIYVYSKNEYLNTIDIVESKLDDFTGKVLRTKSRHKKTGKPDIVSEDFFTYDHMDRLLSHKQTINGSIQELIVNNTYDELGQLMKKDVGNTTVSPLQEIDYTYNVRGWLKKINDPNIGLGKDLFSFELRYNDGGTKLYNGNISQTVWKTANDNTTRHYSYYYDDLNRITRSNYYAWGQNSRFNIGSISYDKNGNIQRLYRRGAIVDNPVISNSSHYSTMDYLMYTYDGNQLTRVKDNGNVNFGFKDGVNKEQEYVYDANGNMTKDDNKGISAISYNHLNLPTSVTIDWNSIQYVYDATGVKLSKTVNSYPSETVTQYAGNYIYENDNLQFFNQPEGYVTPNGSNGFDYIYQYKDHLGNVRLSYTENTEPSRIETIFNDGFIDTMGGWVANGSTNPSLVNGRVRVNVNSPWEGLRNQLEDLEVTPGDKYTVQVKFDKGNTQSNIRFYIQEFDANGSHLRWIGLSWNLQTGQYNYNYTVGANAKKIYLRIDKSNTNTSSQTQFYLDNVTLIKGEAQTVFTDGFDSMANWDRSQNSFGHPISALDSSKKRSGAYSGRIDDNYPTNGEKYVYSDTWTSINNSNDTFYTVSAWVYIENVSDNSAEIFLTTRKSGETGYPSGHYVSDKITQKEQWVYVEKSISVPANVRQLNVRIDNNKDGKVWFDDVKILKGNAAQTLIVEESNYYPFGLKHKGYNNVINGTHHPYGFGGKEENDELGLGWLDFGARNYDASLGRWMNLDPMADKMYDWSPYNYVLNNPLIFIDPNGEYPILITTRSYAPYKTFGPGNKWHGDDRGHSNKSDASSRTSVTITHDTRTQETTAKGSQSRSYTTDGKKDATSRTKFENRSKGEKIDVHSFGNNAAQKGSWDIDQFTKLEANIDGDIDSDHTLNVTGTISGDDFPNQESMISDSEGNTITLGTFETSGDRQWGPVTDLPRENESDTQIKVNVSIKVDKNGVFQGVMVGKKMMSIKDWNKQFIQNKDENKN